MKYLYSEKCTILQHWSMLSFQGQIKPELHPEWSPLGFHANFLKGIHLFDIGYPPPPLLGKRECVECAVKTHAEGSLLCDSRKYPYPPPPRMVNRNS